MRYMVLVFFAVFCLWGSTALAETQVCFDVPTAYEARGLELCNLLKLELPASNNWDIQQCGHWFFWMGLLNYNVTVEQYLGNSARDNAVVGATTFMKTNYPLTLVFTEAVCGNSIVEAHVGEECDPPNGTTCSVSCQDQ